MGLTDLEQMILLATLRVGDGAYAAAIQEDILERGERDVPLGSIYTTMSRLAERGYVSSDLGDPTPERGGKAKRLYQLTPAGIEAVEEARAVWLRMWHGALEPEGGR